MQGHTQEASEQTLEEAPEEALADFVEKVHGFAHLRVEDDLGNGYVRLRSSEAERRQAKQDIRSSEDIVIELLRNARDAGADAIFVATSKHEGKRRITMIDNGEGIPAALHEKVFEPRVTSKLDSFRMDKWGVHGRGMALYSVAQNSEKAFISASDKGLGTALTVETDTGMLGEKKNQSTFPLAVVVESGVLSFRGPRNIIRACCEFAFSHRKECMLYLGTAVEIAASLYTYGAYGIQGRGGCAKDAPARTSADFFAGEGMLGDGLDRVPLSYRLARAKSIVEFSHIAGQLGLPLSERSARRILDGEIKAPENLYERIARGMLDTTTTTATTENEFEQASLLKPPPKKGRARGLKTGDSKTDKAETGGVEDRYSRSTPRISADDLAEFAHDVQEAYRALAERYYLDSFVEPKIKTRKKGISVEIPFKDLE